MILEGSLTFALLFLNKTIVDKGEMDEAIRKAGTRGYSFRPALQDSVLFQVIFAENLWPRCEVEGERG